MNITPSLLFQDYLNFLCRNLWFLFTLSRWFSAGQWTFEKKNADVLVTVPVSFINNVKCRFCSLPLVLLALDLLMYGRLDSALWFVLRRFPIPVDLISYVSFVLVNGLLVSDFWHVGEIWMSFCEKE